MVLVVAAAAELASPPEDAPAVELPAEAPGGQADGDGALGGDRGHEVGVVVHLQLHEPVVLGVRLCLARRAAAGAAVRVVRLQGQPHAARVVEGLPLGGARASARAAAALRVGHAADDLLLAQHRRLRGALPDGQERLQGLHCGEGPAAAAPALVAQEVLGAVEPASPVHGHIAPGLLGRLHLQEGAGAADGRPQVPPALEAQHAAELGVGVVGELVDHLLPEHAWSSIVGNSLLAPRLEERGASGVVDVVLAGILASPILETERVVRRRQVRWQCRMGCPGARRLGGTEHDNEQSGETLRHAFK
mmetsp:Transcript_30280/g.79294  ORF Transcript_30280/g.79294 Transcript_30280/m.79294 type:complete len:305 (+) Transcript_30280:552-1466(+)